MTGIRILCPSGHLGFTPLEPESFRLGCRENPDFIIADSGSCDIGPYPLGADAECSPEEWQRQDLEVMLIEARRLGVPMIIGSAGDTGTNRQVDRFVRIIEEIAALHGLAPFRLAAVYSEVAPEELRSRLARGEAIEGLDGRPDADADVLRRTDRAVAVMGAEPLQAALGEGADVVICGRSSDCAIFAAPLLNAQLGPAVGFYAGKVLECASFAAEPYMANEAVMAVVEADSVSVTPMHPEQRCTPTSVAGHSMYERRSPLRETVAGGYVDMSECRYEQVDARTVRITGFRFVPSDVYKIKLEGSGKVGERRLFVVGVRDPQTISRLDDAIGWSRTKLEQRFGPPGDRYDLFFHVYGRDAVMGALEPTPAAQPLEVGVVVEAVSPDGALAEEVCALAARNLLWVRLPGIKGTAGAAALMNDEVLVGHAGYEWTLNHVIAVDDRLALTSTKHRTVDGGASRKTG